MAKNKVKIWHYWLGSLRHYGNVIMGAIASQITRLTLLNRLFRRRSKKTSKLCVTGLCAGNSPGTGEFPTQIASNAENVSIWWRHHGGGGSSSVTVLTMFFETVSRRVACIALQGRHWDQVTQICVSKLTTIGSDNSLSPGRRYAIIWTNAVIMLIGPLGTNCSEIFIEIHTFSFKKTDLKMSSGKWRSFCLGLYVLTEWCHLGTASASILLFCHNHHISCLCLLIWFVMLVYRRYACV